MTLSTHSVVGASIATIARTNPVLAFFLGFGSHFVLDAIPHWDYPLSTKNVGTDIGIGFVLVLVFFLLPFQSFALLFAKSALWGAFGAVLPDLLIGFHMKFPTKLVSFLHHFHIEIMHSKTRLDHRTILGPVMQVIIISVVLFFTQYFTGA